MAGVAGSGDGARDVIVATLRRLKPARVRAVLLDGAERDIAVPARRRRWESVVEALEQLGGVQRVECLDAKGALLGVVEVDTPPPEPAVEVAEGDKRRSKEYELLDIYIKVGRAATEGQRDAMQVLVSGYRELAGTVMERLQALEGMFSGTLQLAQRAAAAISAASQGEASGGDGDLDRMVGSFLANALGVKKLPGSANGAAAPEAKKEG